MRQRIQKLIGAAALAVFVPLYAILVTMIASAHVPHTSVVIQTAFYAVAGLAWVVPAAAIIYWMQRPDRTA